MSATFVDPPALVAVTGTLPVGGSSTFLVNLARAVRRRGTTLPMVVVDPENAYAREFDAIGNPVHCLPRQRMIYEDRLRWVYEQVASYRPCAVLGCLASSSLEIMRVVPQGVLRMGIVQSDDPGPYGLMSLFAPWLDVVIGVSRRITENFQQYPKLRQVRSACIPYGIDFGPPPERRLRELPEPLRLVYLGRIVEEQKRISRIARLAQLLESRGVPARLDIVGEGPQEDALRETLRDCRIVTFHGPLPYERVTERLLESDVFVLLSDFEGLPLSLLEAMGSGVVPVVSDLASGIAEVVGDSRGFRVPVGDVERAAAIIADLAKDREKLRAHAQNAASFVRAHYSADVMAKKYCDLVNDLARPVCDWPAVTKIPRPKGVRPEWLFAPAFRSVRRWAKRFQ